LKESGRGVTYKMFVYLTEVIQKPRKPQQVQLVSRPRFEGRTYWLQCWRLSLNRSAGYRKQERKKERKRIVEKGNSRKEERKEAKKTIKNTKEKKGSKKNDRAEEEIKMYRNINEKW